MLSGPPGHAQGPSGFAVVDLEATGSSSRRHRVVELAVVLLDRELEPQGEFSTLVDPQGPVGPTHIHGIEPEHLGGAPRFAGIAGRLLGLLTGRVLVGHNVGCDRSFLAAEYARIGLRLPAVPELCTMRMAAQSPERAERAARGGYDPRGRGLSLAACAADAGLLGLTDWHPHTALGDARTTAELFAHYAPAVPFLGDALAHAAAVRWPEPSGVLAAADALWMRRGNDPAGRPANEPALRSVPNVRHGGA